MSFVLLYTLTPGQAQSPPDPDVVPIIYPTTGQIGCSAISYAQQHFLDMFDRLFPVDYMYPLKANTNSGYEIFQASAKVGERISMAVERLECDSYVISAAGGQPAFGSVQFFRSNTASGSFVLKAGSVVTTSIGNRDFVTLSDLSFSSTELGPLSVSVSSVIDDYGWNVRGQVVTPYGTVIAGEIDTCRSLIMAPPYADSTLSVIQLLDMTGGRPPALDGLGADRGILRQLNETDPHYALRIRSLPDTVSPDAINRNLNGYLPSLGISFSMIETFDIRYQTVYDAPAAAIAANPNYSPSLFAYDRPATPHGPFADRWLDAREADGAFIIVVSQNNPCFDVSMAYDDTATVPSDLKNFQKGFQRADSAYDVDPNMSTLLFPGCFDGFDLQFAAAMLGLEDLLQQIKAGGVAAIIEENGQ